ncbi:hypothetical protein N9955_00290 [bacterium]|nr:hypothetical protein [bacterium]
MFSKTTQQKIDSLKCKIAGLEERISIKDEYKSKGELTDFGILRYMDERQKLAELKECLRQLQIKQIKEQ